MFCQWILYLMLINGSNLPCELYLPFQKYFPSIGLIVICMALFFWTHVTFGIYGHFGHMGHLGHMRNLGHMGHMRHLGYISHLGHLGHLGHM